MPSEKHIDESFNPRRSPIQERSRKRFELILDVTAILVAEVGVNGVKTSEIARRAGITLASLYRYFPNKTSIFRSLAKRQLDRIRPDLVGFLDNHDLAAGVDRFIDTYTRKFKTETGFVQLWTGIQAIPELRDLDLEDLRESAHLIADALKSRMPHLDPGQPTTIGMVMARSAGAILRLELNDEDRADALRSELKFMFKAYLDQRLSASTEKADD